MTFRRQSGQSEQALTPVNEDDYTFHPTIAGAKLSPGEMTYVEVGEREEPICLINLDGEFFAIGDTCTHEEASLSEGSISGDEIECPLHGGAYEIRTGMPVAFPIVVPAETFPCRVVDGVVEIGLKK